MVDVNSSKQDDEQQEDTKEEHVSLPQLVTTLVVDSTTPGL